VDDTAPNRLAAVAQIIMVPIVLCTANTPIAVWLIKGWVPIALGVIYAAVATGALIHAGSPRWESLVASLAITFWALRSISYVLAALDHGTKSPWTGATTQAALGLFIGLFYWRAIFRVGFFHRFDEIQQGMREVDG
jgi:hypothetical protein